MKKLLSMAAAAAIFVPMTVAAEAIPQNVLTEYEDACRASCDEAGTDRDCSAMCGCISDRMNAAWSREDFETYSRAYESDPNDPNVRTEMGTFVQQCAASM